MENAFGLDVPRTLEDVCDPRRMALLVYDMQIGIARQLPDKGEQIIPQVARVLKAARAGGYRVFFTRHLSLPKEIMGAFQLRQAMAWQRVEHPDEVQPWFLRDSPGFPIVPELAPQPSEAVLDKITMSAFEGTPLTIALRDCGIQALAIVGVALEIGIEPTARHAADLGIIPVLVDDACGGRDKDAMERSRASLKFMGDALFTDVAAIERLFSRPPVQ